MTGHKDDGAKKMRWTLPCPWCGGEHRTNSKEGRECRRRARRGLPPADPKPARASAPARPGTETTRYQTDPLRGNPRAHAAAKQLKQGTPIRVVAKRMGVPVSFVQDVADRVGHR